MPRNVMKNESEEDYVPPEAEIENSHEVEEEVEPRGSVLINVKVPGKV